MDSLPEKFDNYENPTALKSSAWLTLHHLNRRWEQQHGRLSDCFATQTFQVELTSSLAHTYFRRPTLHPAIHAQSSWWTNRHILYVRLYQTASKSIAGSKTSMILRKHAHQKTKMRPPYTAKAAEPHFRTFEHPGLSPNNWKNNWWGYVCVERNRE